MRWFVSFAGMCWFAFWAMLVWFAGPPIIEILYGIASVLRALALAILPT
jgi:hypothetical protein